MLAAPLGQCLGRADMGGPAGLSLPPALGEVGSMRPAVAPHCTSSVLPPLPPQQPSLCPQVGICLPAPPPPRQLGNSSHSGPRPLSSPHPKPCGLWARHSNPQSTAGPLIPQLVGCKFPSEGPSSCTDPGIWGQIPRFCIPLRLQVHSGARVKTLAFPREIAASRSIWCIIIRVQG